MVLWKWWLEYNKLDYFLEIDTVYYHETYDPLMYFIFFLLIRSEFYLKFAKQLTSKKFIVLALFCMSFYALSILKTIHNPSERPIYQSSDINLTHDEAMVKLWKSTEIYS